jgi:leader peptidase (prepilin peptidase) / N-methyltransferase
MLRILGTIFAALLGLCFGSFLNVCLSRWPTGESIVHPRSHCRDCARTLAWWENIPLISWTALRGRCRTCSTWISIRYPLVEATVGALWAYEASLIFNWGKGIFTIPALLHHIEGPIIASGMALFLWVVVALAILDAENFWLPDAITLPMSGAGVILTVLRNRYLYKLTYDFGPPTPPLAPGLLRCVIDIAVAAAIILLIRFLYQLIRRREGLGLGDAKLMAMLAAWLGLPGALLSLFLGVVLGALFAVTTLAARSRRTQTAWATTQLPLGTFLCIGGIISALWGQPIIESYFRLFP